MAIYTLMSPGGSPGITTTALAITYAWGGRTLLAECDPKGGSVIQGFLTGQIEGMPGNLLDFALAIAHDPDPGVLWKYVVSLDQDVLAWLLLPGIRDPRHSVQLEAAWDAIASVLKTATNGVVDVVLDVGRIGGPDAPMRLIAASDLALMLIRPSLRQVADARPRLDALGRHVGAEVPVAICLIGEGDYTAKQISEALYGLPVIGAIPWDPKSAAVLSDGKRAGPSFNRAPLIRGATDLALTMRSHLGKLQEAGDEAVSR
ncbi:hypothetical protein ACFHYQ_01430 [Sphaerimonospora cavernae]|uniref:Cellulose biosynthesis protein BcsQ n=1 Tax=Sphaerimonospora cavernae TaxID=1740611 RepID=A0ABV6TXM2_9ACTN